MKMQAKQLLLEIIRYREKKIYFQNAILIKILRKIAVYLNFKTFINLDYL